MSKDLKNIKKQEEEEEVTGFPFIHRDVSWLYFNARVLQEAKDPDMPLFERVKFLAIYSNNLGEFFRVRVANLRNLVRVGKKTKKKLDYNPKEALKNVLNIAKEQQLDFIRVFRDQIKPELKSHGIYILRPEQLNEEQQKFIDSYFQDSLLPFVQPVLLVKNKIRPFLNNSELYLTILLEDRDRSNPLPDFKKKTYAIVKVPSEYLPRFIELPTKKGRHDLILLDDVVRVAANWLFPGYRILDSFSIKLTRDAELYIDDEFSGNLMQKIKTSLNKRNVGPAARLVYDAKMPNELLSFLMDIFDLKQLDLLPEGRYHNNFDFFQFPDFGMNHLKNTPLPPLPFPALTKESSVFDEIKKQDYLIHFPYHTYEPVVRFFEDAASDPYVTEIKITQYRVAKKSRIMKALIRAVEQGKKVFAFIEIKARFDEEANLIWGEKLEKAGIKVNYSFPGLKVHSKLAMVTRKEKGKKQVYTYLSTGNFHETTAKLYTDHGLFTADKRLTTEVAHIFSFLETGRTMPGSFKHLLVGQFNLREGFIELIDQEIKNAQAGKEAKMMVKMNSLEDKEMIVKLYEASQAGVKIKMIIRGICCLVPQVKGFSENIEIISIVDRFLEHSRIFVFHNDGDEKIFLSSADWMNRNLSRRIEAAFPIYDKDLKTEILETLNIQWKDNVKARIIDANNSNEFRKNNNGIAVRSQTTTYHYYKKRLE